MKTNKKSILSGIILAFILIGIIANCWIIYEKNKSTEPNVCLIGSSCEEVQNTKYSKMFGINLEFIGLVGFLILLISFFFNKKLFFWISFLGGLIAIYLLGVQFFILKQICSSCLVIDLSMLGIFISTLANYNSFDSKSASKEK